MISGLLLEIVFIVFFAMLGMAILPGRMGKDADAGERTTAFLLTPVIGLAVWMSITMSIGMFVYNKIMLMAFLLPAVVFIVYRRKRLYIIKDKKLWAYIIAAIAVSALMIWSIMPHEINGGIYFTREALDNASKVSLANSITVNGLPPINPYLTYNGELITAYYHFGIEALIAQPVMLFGADSITVTAMTGGLTVTILMLFAAAMVLKYRKKGMALLITFIIIMTGTPQTILEKVLPDSLQNILYPQAAYLGFFSMYSDIAFSAHNYLAAIIMAAVIYLYIHMLKCDDRKLSFYIAALIGLITPAAVYFAVYGGFYVACMLVAAVMILYICRKDMREDINRKIVQHLLMAGLVVLLLLAYVIYLSGRTSIGGTGLEFGLIPAYGDYSGIGIIAAFLDFYFFALPSNSGLVIIFAYLLIFFPKLFPKNRFFEISRVLVIIQLLSMFVIHSSVSTNDYGWRTISITYTIAIVCGAVLMYGLFEKLYEKRKSYGYILTAVCAIICVSNCNTIITCATPLGVESQANKDFKNSLPGWKAVREHTDADDIVMCNPLAFLTVGLQEEANSYNSVNYFSSYYADRYIVIGDLLTPKTSFMGPQSDEEIDELYNRMVDIFSGNPSSEDVKFLADEQKVKALLVVPTDGLWKDEGALTERYELTEDEEYYKVYVLK